MQTTNFCGHEITRLILGDNPFNGYTYIADDLPADELLDYHTEENMIASFMEAERCGINTMVPMADPFVMRTLRHYQQRGGTMNLIFQPYMAVDLGMNINMMKKVNPIGIYHQGTTTDNLYEAGKVDQIKENLKKIRESGVLVGLGTHRPDVIELAEEEGWDVDFYMACLQNARLSRKGVPGSYITGPTKQDLLFFPEDRAIMLDLISRVSKPCIAFKIFAGGQVFHGKPESETPNIIKEVYREVFSKLKPCDVAAIGVYQGRKNQIAENVRLFEEAMAR